MKPLHKKIIIYLSFAVFFFFFGNATLKYIWYGSSIVFELKPEIIKKSGKSTTVFILQKFLNSPDKEKNTLALEMLKEVKDPQMIPMIFKYIHSEDRVLSAKALETLQLMISPEMYNSLIEIAVKSEDRTRLGILQTLASSVTEEEVNILSEYVNDQNWIIRMTLADELRKFKTETSINILEKLINDSVFEVAYTAANTLSELGENNPFAEIFYHLLPDKSWLDKYKSIVLISLYPNKLVNMLIASFLESDFKFLQLAVLEWMAEKGDERDFSYIINNNKKIKSNVVRNQSYITLALLADKIGKKDQLTVNFMRFLKSSRPEQKPALIKALGILDARLAESEIIKYIDSEDLDLAKTVVEVYGKLFPEKNIKNNIGLLKSPHIELRTGFYNSLISSSKISNEIRKATFKNPKTKDEANALGLMILKHFNKNEAHEILKDKYKSAKTKEIKLIFLEYLAASDPSISSLTLLKQLEKKDIASWHKVKNIASRSRAQIIPSAIVAGFRFYRSRIPEKTLYTVMSFTSSSDSFWDHKDILYLKGKNKGKVEGSFIHEDYNSYYFSTQKDEVVQIEKRLVKSIVFSPLNEMKRLKEDLKKYKYLFNEALKDQKWDFAGYLIHKAMLTIQIMSAEIKHFRVAKQCMDQEALEWLQLHKKFTVELEKNNLLKVHGKYTTLKELKANEIQKLDPEEAKQLQSDADKIFDAAAELANSGDLEGAVKKYHQALDVWPFHHKSIREIGTVLVRMDRFKEAIDFYNKLLKKRPDDQDIYNSMSLIFRLKGDFTQALDYLTQEIELDPSSERARIGAAEVLVELNKTDDAIELLESGINLIDKPYDSHYMLTKLYRQNKEVDSAILNIDKCIELKPDDINAYTYKAILLYTDGNVKEAVKVLKKALSIDMGNITARMTLVDIYLSAGENESAKEELIKVISIDPANMEAKEILESLN